MNNIKKYQDYVTQQRVHFWAVILKRRSVVSAGVRLTMKERTVFIKRLAMLLRSGMPITQSLLLMCDQAEGKSQKMFFSSLVNDVSSGQTLSLALSKYASTFGGFTINVIQIGEETGTLAENLEYIAQENKKKYELQRQIQGALIYPAIIIFSTLGITLFLVVYIFPKIIPIFTSLKIDLPLSTKILIFLSDAIRSYGLWFLITIILLSAVYWSLRAWVPLARLRDSVYLKLPIFGKLCKYYNTVNFCRTLGLLLRNDVKIEVALLSIVSSTSHLQYKSAFVFAREGVITGKTVSSQLKLYPELFPSLCIQMIQSGENSGNLSYSLTFVSEVYESEIKDLTKNITTVIEPVLMLLMGLCVGFIAISIVTPIYSITNNLHA